MIVRTPSKDHAIVLSTGVIKAKHSDDVPGVPEAVPSVEETKHPEEVHALRNTMGHRQK